MKKYTDLLIFAGWVALSFGVWQIYQPAGYIVGGGLAIFAGIAIEKAE